MGMSMFGGIDKVNVIDWYVFHVTFERIFIVFQSETIPCSDTHTHSDSEICYQGRRE